MHRQADEVDRLNRIYIVLARHGCPSHGVGVRRWISMHGFALNVCGPLDGFAHITPCGIAGVEMTSLEREGAAGVTVESVATRTGERFIEMFARVSQ